jgi:hypothetical protein
MDLVEPREAAVISRKPAGVHRESAKALVETGWASHKGKARGQLTFAADRERGSDATSMTEVQGPYR